MISFLSGLAVLPTCYLLHDSRLCKWEVIVQGDEGPIFGVAQVLCHGVIVVVGHQEEGQEEKGEKQGEVEGEVAHHGWYGDGVNGLEPCGV